MDTISIRLADMQDREALCKLYIKFHEFHVRRVPERLLSLGNPDSYDCSELYMSLEKIINSDDSALFLAEIADRVVGLAEVYVRQDEPNPAKVTNRYGYLQSLMIDEAFRRQGIGTRLVETAHQWAKRKGATEMRLETWEFAEAPLEFYEHIGYRTLRRMLVRGL